MLVYSYHPKKSDFSSWNLEISYEPYDEYRRYKVMSYTKIANFNNPPEGMGDNFRCIKKRRSFVEKILEYSVNDVFRFGKYANRKIAEVKDLPYTKWYYENIEDGDHKKFIKEFLYDNWYEFRKNENGFEEIITPKRAKFEADCEKKRNEFLDNLDCYKTYYLEPKHNPNGDGEINIDGIIYTFPKVRAFYYDDICYYLPLCNGKAKRIKNKMLECRLMYFDNKIFISNFKIAK